MDHRRAEALAAEAAKRALSGRLDEARELYRAAADFERKAVAIVAPGRQRTFSILAVSHASLLYKGGDLVRAEQVICGYLGDEALTSRGRGHLRELLEVIWDEQVIQQQGREYSGEEIWFSLRGGNVGSGTAPIDSALHSMASGNSLVYRSVEWQARFPLRQRGLPPPAVVNALQARATQPVPGSFRFSVRLTRPAQPNLFPEDLPEARIDPSGVSAFVVRFVNSVVRGDASAVERLVPEPRYRRALLQLTRNLVPTSGAIGEVEITRVWKGEVESATIVPAVKGRISAALARSVAEDDERQQEPGELIGVLRALHLDDDWLQIDLPDGGRQRCETPEDVLDDVVGPMVNKQVRVTGYWESPRDPRRRRVFRLRDIELAG